MRQVHIIKDRSQPPSFKNSRPITIQPPLIKIIDYTIKQRLADTLNQKDNQNAFMQTGFKKGLGTEININIITQNLIKKLEELKTNDKIE